MKRFDCIVVYNKIFLERKARNRNFEWFRWQSEREGLLPEPETRSEGLWESLSTTLPHFYERILHSLAISIHLSWASLISFLVSSFFRGFPWRLSLWRQLSSVKSNAKPFNRLFLKSSSCRFTSRLIISGCRNDKWLSLRNKCVREGRKPMASGSLYSWLWLKSNLHIERKAGRRLTLQFQKKTWLCTIIP